MDWYCTPEGAARLENMVASYLYRSCRVLTDQGYGLCELHYIRTLDKKEIDFVICRDHRPLVAIEVKKTETSVSRPLANRDNWLTGSSTLGIQVVDQRDVLQKYNDRTWVMSVERLLTMID